MGLLFAQFVLVSIPAAAAQEAEFEELASRAASARESDRLPEAIELYQQALRLNESWDEGWWYLGTLFYELDRYAEGRDAFRRLVALTPEAGPAWALQGLCEFREREYDRALASLQRGRTLGLGGNRELQSVTDYHAALLLNRFEQFEAAWDILFRLARQDPNNPRVAEAMGICSLRLPYLPAEVPASHRDAVARAGRAGVFVASYRMENAENEYKALAEQYSEMDHVNYAYGVFLLQSEPTAALEHFRKELRLNPSHLPARLQIAFEYLKQGDPEAGLGFAREAVRLDPTSFAARNALGRIYLELGELDTAIQELERGVSLVPESPEMRFALAQAYARAGRAEEAARERSEFARLDRIRRTRRDGPQSVGGLIPPE